MRRFDLLKKLQAESYCQSKEKNSKDNRESLKPSFSGPAAILLNIGIYLAAECTESCIFSFLHQYHNDQRKTNYYKNYG